MHSILFNNMSLPYSRPACEPFTPPVQEPRLWRESRVILKTASRRLTISHQEVASLQRGEEKQDIRPEDNYAIASYLSLPLDIHLHAPSGKFPSYPCSMCQQPYTTKSNQIQHFNKMSFLHFHSSGMPPAMDRPIRPFLHVLDLLLISLRQSLLNTVVFVQMISITQVLVVTFGLTVVDDQLKSDPADTCCHDFSFVDTFQE